MARRRIGSRQGLALVAVLMLVLQSVAAASAGPRPDLRQFDSVGNPLCITGANHSDTEHGGDRNRPPECCTPGCCMSPPLPATPSEGASLLAPPPSSRTALTSHCGFLVRKSEHNPGSARAPPLAA
ncbi:hypothetical protein [Sinorhizobium fredii]|uniref:Transmembrane protein n=2 Tax=Rhizobium fredii TaxID=380 RepID=A0A844A946_RHIFR|nr:hypothetical protein [Sinorhizobium fredii]AWI56641.1 hypothetical protein AB395_0000964 [Sinorhizobium fredii CCBAU 45436]MQW96635.1 hypothetical protein [Sinorhizobium fredii]MQX09714.1 hypothetical protein [Sinorhizobium fredii]UTY48855.1 hypothetical protein EPK84_19800 [Sinorhizobium fredii]CCE95440.1 hypothetical protein SFHH103_00941 [Sinorhizobium fredii HH103]